MLRISKLTDYGTVILAYLASQPDRLLAAAEVAERTRVALPTVSKLLKTLQRSGLVTSTRGSHGGYQLALPAAEITAARILDALEGPFAITECSGQHSSCGIESNCRVGHVWQRVNSAIRRALNDVTLAQLAGVERAGTTTIPLTRITRATHE
ncbi:FeS assembly SUF system regulator [Povalibacter uvarum]|uniref:FeS assembly SUF system regulator n=1 Tax=Povalibacter uvarum TaxID=732238 RepID=A0A841HEH6_9GAMM|nr:SUF system Fe-S cluster assembly regulator [Povalibacter uvarum]MBB6091521.1 FeS assembly SUF system regulator [Povalibacter uvarum]